MDVVTVYLSLSCLVSVHPTPPDGDVRPRALCSGSLYPLFFFFFSRSRDSSLFNEHCHCFLESELPSPAATLLSIRPELGKQ